MVEAVVPPFCSMLVLVLVRVIHVAAAVAVGWKGRCRTRLRLRLTMIPAHTIMTVIRDIIAIGVIIVPPIAVPCVILIRVVSMMSAVVAVAAVGAVGTGASVSPQARALSAVVSKESRITPIAPQIDVVCVLLSVRAISREAHLVLRLLHLGRIDKTVQDGTVSNQKDEQNIEDDAHTKELYDSNCP